MSFSVKDWKDDPDTSTPLSAAALEDMETRLSGYTDTVGAAATPADGSVTATKVASSLKPSGSAGTTDESLRRLGTGSTHAAAGDDSRFPSSGEKNALAGSSGTPGSGNKYVTDADSRLSDARTPTFPITYTGSATDDVVKTKVTSDTQQRFILNADGIMEWGAGSGATDTTLQRSAAAKLQMTDPGAGNPGGFMVGTAVTFGRAASGNIGIQLSDTGIDRRGAGLIRIGDGTSTGYFEVGPGYLQGIEQGSDPAAPSANIGRIFFKDNGAGKTQLAVRFSTGATQIIATEP